MAKVIHHHHDEPNDSGMGFMLGVLILITFLAVFFYWGLPFLRTMVMQTQRDGGINIQVPDKVDVNINTQQQQPAQ